MIEYNYQLSDTENNAVDIELLHTQIKTVLSAFDGLSVRPDEQLVTCFFSSELSTKDQTALDTLIHEHDGGILQAKLREIDQRTDELILEGFVFKAMRFSLSLEAQTRLAWLTQNRNHLNYPILWNTIDNTSVLELQDAHMVDMFCAIAAKMCRACLDSGTELKSLVLAASTAAEIQAIEDDRSQPTITYDVAEKNFLVAEYYNGKLISETWYGIDNGDGTYSERVEETIYTYGGHRDKTLLFKTITMFLIDGTPAAPPVVWEYVTDGDKKIIKKVGA